MVGGRGKDEEKKRRREGGGGGGFGWRGGEMRGEEEKEGEARGTCSQIFAQHAQPRAYTKM